MRIVLAAAVALALAAPAAARAAAPPCPSRSPACVTRLSADMKRNLDRLGCDHNAAFALLYWRTTQGIQLSIKAGAFSDPPYWNQITTAFGRYYLDAFDAWRSAHPRRAPEAWRIAFRAAERGRVSTAGDLFLGINAHVNRDLAFVYDRLRLRNHRDHLQVNTVLANVRPVVFPELIARFDPQLVAETSRDPKLSLDIVAWRELAWRNAKRLARARTTRARRAVAAGIEGHANAMARRIIAAFPTTGAANAARDAFCRAH